MAEGDESGEAERLVESLERDAYFGAWAGPGTLPDDAEFVLAAHEVLNGGAPGGLPALDPERSMRRLVLLQIVRPYLDGTVSSWEVLFERLAPEDRANVEALLGAESLAEFLQPEPRWVPPEH